MKEKWLDINGYMDKSNLLNDTIILYQTMYFVTLFVQRHMWHV